jgi:TatD DNase family protein
MQQINLHTHQINSGTNVQILNVFAQDLPFLRVGQPFSTGLHPWHIGKVNPDDCLLAIEKVTAHKNMLAVGECGLDRSIDAAFAIQELYFKKQIEIAEKHHKPLIIHCVRAYFDLIRMKKELKSYLPWVIHGYNGNLETTKSLNRHDFYFSVGESFLTDERKRESFLEIPLDRLFFETDDNDIPIQKIYLFAAEILKTSEDLLAEAIFNNFKTIFGNGKLVTTD